MTGKNANDSSQRESFLVAFWSRLFDVLSRISIFNLIRITVPRLVGWYAFVDVWVIFHSLLALSTFVITVYKQDELLLWFLVIYGLTRSWEILIYQLNVLLFASFRAQKKNKDFKVLSFERLVLALAHNYFEIALWFASAFVFFSHSIQIDAINALDIFRNSFTGMITVGMDGISALDFDGTILIICHTFVGLTLTLLALARIINLLPGFKSKVEHEQDPES